ncbi:MAG: SdiA-regulated domain-containing protein [Bacteroidota bacterium]
MAEGYHFPYHLREPDQTMELAPALNEISGLSMAYRDTRIAAVNDELGIIYLLDPQDGKILQEIPFWKTGDYEGIEVKGSDAYIVKSSGTIYEVKYFGTEGQEVTKYNTVLGKENDVEGFCFNREGDKLLLACKGQAGIKGQDVEVKNIYSFDLETKTVDTIPYQQIVRARVNEFLQQNTTIPKLEKLVEFFDPSHPSFTLAPSAIAIQPGTGHLFLTSSVGKVFMVLDTDGKILYIEKLSKKIHPQPEGMCFANDGTLYISSEGKELGVGRIQKFVLKR